MGTNTLQSRQYQEKIEQSQPTFPLSRLNLEKMEKWLKWSPSFIGAKSSAFSSLISWLCFISEEHKLKATKSTASHSPLPYPPHFGKKKKKKEVILAWYFMAQIDKIHEFTFEILTSAFRTQSVLGAVKLDLVPLHALLNLRK